MVTNIFFKNFSRKIQPLVLALCGILISGCAVISQNKCALLRADDNGNSPADAAFYLGAALITHELAPECRFGKRQRTPKKQRN